MATFDEKLKAIAGIVLLAVETRDKDIIRETLHRMKAAVNDAWEEELRSSYEKGGKNHES